MHARFASSSSKPPAGRLIRLLRLGLVFLPVILLLLASVRAPESTVQLLWLGTLVQGLGCILALMGMQYGREPVGPLIIVLYVIGLGWLIFGTSGAVKFEDWYLHLAQALLLVIPLFLFAVQCLRDSGAPALRRARSLAQRLAQRKNWPADLLHCRLLPEVKALREALHVDASPALNLLNHPRPEVRVAALAALEFRQNWRPGQPQAILQLARLAPEPEVRAGAINALANTDDRILLEALAEFLDDRSLLVRNTTTEALLWKTEGRWGWISHAVRKALADPACHDDGPLPVSGNRLGPEALADLQAWATEKGVLAERAALTLSAHYAQQLIGGDPELVQQLRAQLLEPHAPPILRLELTRLLYQHRELDGPTLQRLLDPVMPSPVRLIAADALLGISHASDALVALIELARLPNREIALATAEVVQRRLGIDMGLPRGQDAPAVCSRMAAEVARRVLIWATQQGGFTNDSTPMPRPSHVSRRLSPP
jgi:hypothetical protein